MAALPENDRIAGPFIAVAGQTDFPADFPLIRADGLRVRRERQGVSTILMGAAVAAVAVGADGFTARVTDPCIVGDRCWVFSDLSPARLRQHVPNGAIRSATLEGDAMDLQAQLQEHRALLDLAITAPIGDEPLALPGQAARAGRFLTFDEQGRPLAVVRPDDFDILNKASLIEPDFTRPTVSGRPIISAPALHFPVYMDNISVVEGAVGGDGVANSAAINAWMLANPGKVLRERPGALYRIGSRLRMQEGSRLVCESVSNRATLYMTTAFSNTNFTQRDTATSCGILAVGQTSGSFTPISNVGFENLIVQSDPADGRVLRGLNIRNALNTQVINVEVFGIPCGVGMCLSGARGNTLIENAYIHDFITNSTAYTGSGFGQLTAIEFDNDLINGIVSEGVRISSPKIDNLTPGAAFIAAWGDQSDGINIARTTARAFVINGAAISRVNEAIDVFGQDNSIIGGTYTDCRGQVIKFVHGAKRNSIISPTIIRPGLSGLSFHGSSTAGVGDTAYNVVSGGIIQDANPLNDKGASTTAGIHFNPNSGEALNQLPRNNTVTGTVLVSGLYGRYGWLDEITAGKNVGEGLDIPAGWTVARVLAPNAGGTGGVRLKRTASYTESLN